jgi:hypothetical protein
MREAGGSIQPVMDLVGPLGATIASLSSGSDPSGQEEPVIQLRLKMKSMVLQKRPDLLAELRGIPGVKQVQFRMLDGKSRRDN